MPSRDPLHRFEDILENIALIENFTSGMDLRSFSEDSKTSSAVERCLERISEAAKKLEGHSEACCPEIAWPQLRALGNLLRHEYDRVDLIRIWLLIEDNLPPLRRAVKRAIDEYNLPKA